MCIEGFLISQWAKHISSIDRVLVPFVLDHKMHSLDFCLRWNPSCLDWTSILAGTLVSRFFLKHEFFFCNLQLYVEELPLLWLVYLYEGVGAWGCAAVLQIETLCPVLRLQMCSPVRSVWDLKTFVLCLGLKINPDRPDGRLPYRGAWFWVGAEMIHVMELPNPDPLTGRPAYGGRDRHTCVALKSLEGVKYVLEKAGEACL